MGPLPLLPRSPRRRGPGLGGALLGAALLGGVLLAAHADPDPHRDGAEPCRACRGLTDSFIRGLERTEHEGFGGGNTAWEEEKLSKYQHSETRLLEVLEGVCAPSDFTCHQLLERSEEHVEQWWFHERQQHPDFFQWLCVDRLMLCCPPGTYGPDCRPCAGGPRQPCSGNGRCDGDGTRRGTGLCVCSPGYGGPFCAECGDGYYEASRNKSHLVCAECYQACGRCTGPEDSSCLRCKRGWVLHEHRCIDIDECGTEMAHCRANQYCVNTEGSYECRGQGETAPQLALAAWVPGRLAARNATRATGGMEPSAWTWMSVPVPRSQCAQGCRRCVRTQRAATAASVPKATSAETGSVLRTSPLMPQRRASLMT
ncbi:protein disulfide isomerase CRELD1 isoform X4 [Parus major]|uniref:protein disulfide isomerase CRELD1 isoform X4 n=1 Tax=Parus major TaxID=9157 RepID=UPI0014444AFD|nr:protein disulfide isomerase CRELD1 isoform X4 [Parus major]